MSSFSKLYCFNILLCYDLVGDVMDKILSSLIDEKRKSYKCFSMLKYYYDTDPEFAEFIRNGVLSGKILGYDEELWNKMASLNVRNPINFEEAFGEGFNEGNCTKFSKYLSFCFTYSQICGGTLPLIKGSKNSPDGRHTWISYKGMIYDTSLMLIMEEEYAKRGLKYNEENRYNPNRDPSYAAAKEFANDKSLKH